MGIILQTGRGEGHDKQDHWVKGEHRCHSLKLRNNLSEYSGESTLLSGYNNITINAVHTRSRCFLNISKITKLSNCRSLHSVNG